MLWEKISLSDEEYKDFTKHYLYFFYHRYVASKYSNVVHADHIEKLARKLTNVYLGKIKRLCVAIPPRHSKSSMVTLAYPLWLIFQNPNLNILIVNAEASLSENFGIRLRELIKENGAEYDVYLSDVKHSSTHIKFENSKGELYQGSIRLVGSTGSITGQDADYLIIDDPYKGMDDITPTQLEKKINWFDSIIEQRIEPQTRLIILHTRWHTNDLQGFFKRERSNDYEFIEFPAITSDGTPLWKERYSIEVLEKKRDSIGERLFQSIYQQKPIDDTSDFFELNNIHWCAPPLKKDEEDDDGLEPVKMVRGWDIAASDNATADYTAGVPVYLLSDNKSILITDYIHGQFGQATSDTVKQTVHQDGADTIHIIETGTAAAGKILFDEWKKQLTGYFIKRGIPVPNKSKADRATPLANKIYDGEVYVDIKDDKLRQTFIDEFKAFPQGMHDDIVDATAYAYNYINDNLIGIVPFEFIEW